MLPSKIKNVKLISSLDGGQKDENIRSEQYSKLLDLGLVEQVAAKLDTIYSEGLVNVRKFLNKYRLIL